VIVDPITNFVSVGTYEEIKSMLMRLVDFLKANHITGLFTSLTNGGSSTEKTDVAVSSLIDTWLLLRDMEVNGERNRVLYLLKSRGMAHSNQVREFLLTDRGIELMDVYTGSEGVLTGSARLDQVAKERAATLLREQDIQRKQRELERKRQAIETQIAALRCGLAADEEELQLALAQARGREEELEQNRLDMGLSRKDDPNGVKGL
jgi:circadian clock protein KaiC